MTKIIYTLSLLAFFATSTSQAAELTTAERTFLYGAPIAVGAVGGVLVGSVLVGGTAEFIVKNRKTAEIAAGVGGLALGTAGATAGAKWAYDVDHMEMPTANALEVPASEE